MILRLILRRTMRNDSAQHAPSQPAGSRRKKGAIQHPGSKRTKRTARYMEEEGLSVSRKLSDKGPLPSLLSQDQEEEEISAAAALR